MVECSGRAAPIINKRKQKRLPHHTTAAAYSGRRARDSNPRTGITGLAHFECAPLDRLGNPP